MEESKTHTTPSSSSSSSSPPFDDVFFVDTECLATGNTHEDREICELSIVNLKGEVVYDSKFNVEPIFSPMEIFTGVKDKNDFSSFPMYDPVTTSSLFKNKLIVTNAVHMDFLNMKLDLDSNQYHWFDVSHILSIPTKRYLKKFSLRHMHNQLDGVHRLDESHNCLEDALMTRDVFLSLIRMSSVKRKKYIQRLDTEKRPPSIYKQFHGVYDGVCIGNGRGCACGREAKDFGDHREPLTREFLRKYIEKMRKLIRSHVGEE